MDTGPMHPNEDHLPLVALPSAQSLMIEMRWSGASEDQPALATGTGFVVVHEDRHYLITNRHNFTGRDAAGKIRSDRGLAPDQVRIRHNSVTGTGRWIKTTEQLLDVDESPMWLEHPTFGEKVDVVALRLSSSIWAKYYPYDVNEPTNGLFYGPSSAVSVVGFPFSRHVEGLAIWTQGFVASDPDIDYEKLPRFLIDARTRPGQSGSPVIIYRQPGDAIARRDLTIFFSTGSEVELLGVYSGRINNDSDLGFVWKTSAIAEVLQGGFVPPSVPEAEVGWIAP